ncbi:DUF2254 domain-containing protein [Maricaulis sp. CAU 1757]
MLSNFKLQRILSSIWLRPALFAFAAILVVLLTPALSRLIPQEWVGWVETKAVEQTLSILASSMLAVAIFSLATLFSAFEAAAQAATPRARALMTEDRTAQYAVSTFIGAFLFSILGLVGLNTYLYNEVGIHILFLLSLLVIGIVVFTLVRWIERLGSFGGVEEAIRSVEMATRSALHRDSADPARGGLIRHEPPAHSSHICAEKVGYVQAFDHEALGQLTREHGCAIHIEARPGTLVGPGQPLAWCTRDDTEICDAIRDSFTIGRTRTFEQDPRFGVICLAEIAIRALSPAVNDPGTAINVMSALIRVLDSWSAACRKHAGEAPKYPDLSIPPLQAMDLLNDGFLPIARDGAAYLEVGIRLNKSLAMLRRTDEVRFAEACNTVSAYAESYAGDRLLLDRERACLADLRSRLALETDDAR